MLAEKLPETAAIQLPGIGQPLQGGFFTGLIKVGEHTYALITAPKKFEIDRAKYGEYGQDIAGAKSTNDCLANTLAMAEAGSESAKAVLALEIDGYTDWLIPSRDAAEIQYRQLKPTAQENYCSWRDGDNPSSIPPGHIYSENSPAQTTVDAFKEGGEEAFEAAYYGTSTQYSAYAAYVQGFSAGVQTNNSKFGERRFRPVRRLLIS
jgi:hypothetical protein